MSRKVQYIWAAVVAFFGLVALGAAFSTDGSVREFVDGKYQASTSSDPKLKGALVYKSSDPPSRVVEEITKAWKPADRHVDPAGHFLRYSNDFIVVAPVGTGSSIIVDEQDRGYVRWYPYVGGYWGTYSAPGEAVRGGGPGAGK